MNKKNGEETKVKHWNQRISSFIKKHGSGIAIIISLISLFLAWLPFYYQYIRKHDDLKAVILSFAINHPEGIGYVSDVVFVNNGNQPCSIANIEIQMQNIDTKDPIRSGLLSSPTINQYSFTIKPNEVITKQFWAVKGGIKDNQFNSYGNKDERLNFSLVFEIIDSLGNYHRVLEPVCLKKIGDDSIRYPERLPKSITLLPSKRYTGFVTTLPRKIDK